MKTNKFKNIPFIITAILTLLFCPLVLAWANMSLELLDVSPTFNDFLGKTTKPYFAYLFTLGAWIETVYSCICDDPVAHASDRGYSLK